jgi:hypothetical protein
MPHRTRPETNDVRAAPFRDLTLATRQREARPGKLSFFSKRGEAAEGQRAQRGRERREWGGAPLSQHTRFSTSASSAPLRHSQGQLAAPISHVRPVWQVSPPEHVLGPAHSTQHVPAEPVQLKCPWQEWAPVHTVSHVGPPQVMGEEHEWSPVQVSSQSPEHETGVWQL